MLPSWSKDAFISQSNLSLMEVKRLTIGKFLPFKSSKNVWHMADFNLPVNFSCSFNMHLISNNAMSFLQTIPAAWVVLPFHTYVTGICTLVNMLCWHGTQYVTFLIVLIYSNYEFVNFIQSCSMWGVGLPSAQAIKLLCL